MAASRRVASVLIVCATWIAAACRPGPATTPELQSLLARESPPFPQVSTEVWSETTRFYAARQQTFAWVDGKRPTADTVRALDVLRQAVAHGLDPARYSEPELRQLHAALEGGHDGPDYAGKLALLDVRLTASLLQLGRHVATGSLPPSVVDPRWNARRDPPDFLAALTKGGREGIETFLPAVQPRHPEYAALMHTLTASGTLDAATVNASSVPMDVRVRQVAINLERWRWLPDDLGSRHFIVNVPEFHLIARESGRPVLDIRVVVGKRGKETPLFSDQMEEVVFSPYWNVPETIARAETAPAAARDPGFLQRNNMEVVDVRGQVISADAIPKPDCAAIGSVSALAPAMRLAS